jgi:predicted glycosyl hydrolase (DUF1957 family)
VDGYCLQTESKPFVQLDRAEQTKILLQLFESSDANLRTGREFVASAKQWTAKIYYSTQVGQKELNKDGRVPTSYDTTCGEAS